MYNYTYIILVSKAYADTVWDTIIMIKTNQELMIYQLDHTQE